MLESNHVAADHDEVQLILVIVDVLSQRSAGGIGYPKAHGHSLSRVYAGLRQLKGVAGGSSPTSFQPQRQAGQECAKLAHGSRVMSNVASSS